MQSETQNASEPTQTVVPESGTIRHSHGPNFGRYVAGCPRCEHIKAHPEAKMRNPKRKAREETPTMSVTPDELQVMLQKIVAENQAKAENLEPVTGPVSMNNITMLNMMELMKVFARELKAPDPVEAEKLAREKARQEEAKKRRLQEIELEMKAKADAEAMCASYGHKKENGASAMVQGQVHNDGNFHPFCLRCGAKGQLIKAQMEHMTAV